MLPYDIFLRNHEEKCRVLYGTCSVVRDTFNLQISPPIWRALKPTRLCWWSRVCVLRNEGGSLRELGHLPWKPTNPRWRCVYLPSFILFLKPYIGPMFSFLPSCSNLNLLVFLYTWLECKANNQRGKLYQVGEWRATPAALSSQLSVSNVSTRGRRPALHSLNPIASDIPFHFVCAVRRIPTEWWY